MDPLTFPPPYAVLKTNDVVMVSRPNGQGQPYPLGAVNLSAMASLFSSIDPGLALSAGLASASLAAVVFSNSNNVSFGLNGSTVTASVPLSPVTHSFYEPLGFGGNTSFSSFGQGSIYFDPMDLDANISFSQVNQLASFNMSGASSNPGTSGQAGLTQAFAVYGRSAPGAGSTALTIVFSASNTISGAWSASSSSISMSYGWQTGTAGGSSSTSFSTNGAGLTNASFEGQMIFSVGCNTVLAPGEYWLACSLSSSTAGGASASSIIRASNLVFTNMTNGSWSPGFGQGSSTNVQAIEGLGVFSVTSASFPTSVAFTQISFQSLNRRYYNFQA